MASPTRPNWPRLTPGCGSTPRRSPASRAGNCCTGCVSRPSRERLHRHGNITGRRRGIDTRRPIGPDHLLPSVREAIWRRRPLDGREAAAATRPWWRSAACPHPSTATPTSPTSPGRPSSSGRDGILLHRHKRLGIWVQPGGHLEPVRPRGTRLGARAGGDRPFLAWPSRPGRRPRRRPPLPHLDVHAGGRGHTHLDLRYRLWWSAPRRLRRQAGESQDVRWFSWPEAPPSPTPDSPASADDDRHRVGERPERRSQRPSRNRGTHDRTERIGSTAEMHGTCDPRFTAVRDLLAASLDQRHRRGRVGRGHARGRARWSTSGAAGRRGADHRRGGATPSPTCGRRPRP